MVRGTTHGHIIQEFPNVNQLKPPTRKNGTMKRPGGYQSTNLKTACDICNRGWMKNIVDTAIPIVSQLDFGFWGKISVEDKKVASWITIYAISFEFGHKKTVCVSSHERHSFRKIGIPSQYWQTAIGYGDHIIDADLTKYRAISLHPYIPWDGHRKSQITAFFHGHLIALVYYSEDPHFTGFVPFVRRLGLELIWPDCDTLLRKPFRTHNDGAVEGLVNDLTAALSR